MPGFVETCYTIDHAVVAKHFILTLVKYLCCHFHGQGRIRVVMSTQTITLNFCLSADERGAAKDTCKGEDDQAACGAASGNQGLGCRVCGLRVGL